MVKKRLGCKWSGYGMGSDIWKPTIWNPDKWLPFCQKQFEIRTKWSGFQMVGNTAIAIGKARTFENLTIWNTTFKESGFWMVGVQISTIWKNMGHFVRFSNVFCSSRWEAMCHRASVPCHNFEVPNAGRNIQRISLFQPNTGSKKKVYFKPTCIWAWAKTCHVLQWFSVFGWLDRISIWFHLESG